MLAKGSSDDSSSMFAQGGIAAALGPDDSTEAHAHDTIEAGAGLCQPETVEFVAGRGPQSIEWLQRQGVAFTREAGGGPLHLTQEGGHSQRRVAHVADATGRAVVETLALKAQQHPRIRYLGDHIAIDLITSTKLARPGPNRCLGVYALDQSSGRVASIGARLVVLATGGASKVYLYTSNPDTSTGDGIAMAWRAGCRVANMEFMQFHPTCLYHPRAKSFLISEAVRGEGGRLLLPDGTRFMPGHHPAAELAPRDVVARAIDYEMKRGGFDSVFLDISHKPGEFVRRHFPNIVARCAEFGFDLTREPVPVVPAAHYTCGGIVTDLDARTDLDALYALGECAFTGLHGANRMASNSLLECLVFAEAASGHITETLAEQTADSASLPDWDESQVGDPDERIVVSHNWDELRRFMWDYVGIVRSNKRLDRALRRVELLKEEIRDYYSNFKVSNDLLELRNLVTVAELIIRSAQARQESRGLHYNLDYPDSLPPSEACDTVFSPETL